MWRWEAGVKPLILILTSIIHTAYPVRGCRVWNQSNAVPAVPMCRLLIFIWKMRDSTQSEPQALPPTQHTDRCLVLTLQLDLRYEAHTFHLWSETEWPESMPTFRRMFNDTALLWTSTLVFPKQWSVTPKRLKPHQEKWDLSCQGVASFGSGPPGDFISHPRCSSKILLCDWLLAEVL